MVALQPESAARMSTILSGLDQLEAKRRSVDLQNYLKDGNGETMIRPKHPLGFHS